MGLPVLLVLVLVQGLVKLVRLLLVV